MSVLSECRSSSGTMRAHDVRRSNWRTLPGRFALPVEYISQQIDSPDGLHANPTKEDRSKWLSVRCAEANLSQSSLAPMLDAATWLITCDAIA